MDCDVVTPAGIVFTVIRVVADDGVTEIRHVDSTTTSTASDDAGYWSVTVDASLFGVSDN